MNKVSEPFIFKAIYQNYENVVCIVVSMHCIHVSWTLEVVLPWKLELFIEHIPRAERQGACSATTIDVTSLPMRIGRAAIAYTVFVYGHIQGVGVTPYRIYNILYCEAGEVGPNVTNNRK